MKNEKYQIDYVKNHIEYSLTIDNIDSRIKNLELCLNLCDNISKSQRLKLKRLINDCIIDAENKL